MLNISTQTQQRPENLTKKSLTFIELSQLYEGQAVKVVFRQPFIYG
jgi:hypothetical protein